MIFGDVASGKSTFSKKLGKTLDIPITHLDEVMGELGRADKVRIGEYIQNVIDSDSWIIEGNAFTKDKNKRIESADIIYVFESSRLITFWRWLKRALRARYHNKEILGGATDEFKFSYYIPYIFWKFPPRREKAKEYALFLAKRVVSISSYKQANDIINAV